jgi:hypothetical protein
LSTRRFGGTDWSDVQRPLGGMLGAVVGHMNVRRRSSASLSRYLAKGVLVKLLTCLVYFGLGINLLQFDVNVQFFNELAVRPGGACGGVRDTDAVEIRRVKLRILSGISTPRECVGRAGCERRTQRNSRNDAAQASDRAR